jgi:phenylacetate-CoA ligase
MYTAICSSILFPLHERLKGHHSLALRRELERTQWWSAERIRSLQIERLGAFLDRAAASVPYYLDSLRAVGKDLRRVSSLDELRAVPFLTKELIRANTEALKSTRAGRLLRYNTGGSSGQPLVFYIGPGRVSHDVAAKWRATRWWEVDIGDTEVVLWGSPIEIGKQDRIKAFRDRMFRSYLLPAFSMSPAQMDAYLDRIEALRPKMVFGYASAVARLAQHAEERSRTLSSIGVKVVFTTGETLYPEQRAVIERVLGAPVANGYGSRDAGFIAHQCPRGALHLCAEHIVVEVVDAAGDPVAPGGRGEIVTTHLATDDFPFIRYRTGDMAVLATEPCACGRGLPALREVFGRTTDFIRTVGGETMHALALIYEVRDRPGVRAFKFIQAEDLSLRLLLVADAALTAAVQEQIRQGLLARMGARSVINIEVVEDIPPERSGKYRYVVSHAIGDTLRDRGRGGP